MQILGIIKYKYFMLKIYINARVLIGTPHREFSKAKSSLDSGDYNSEICKIPRIFEANMI